jgi:hypothetical protein
MWASDVLRGAVLPLTGAAAWVLYRALESKLVLERDDTNTLTTWPSFLCNEAAIIDASDVVVRPQVSWAASVALEGKLLTLMDANTLPAPTLRSGASYVSVRVLRGR